MVQKTKTLGIVAACILLSARPLLAQIAAPKEPAPLTFGPVSLHPTLQLLDAGVDENVFNDGSNPQSDYTMTVATRVLAVLRMGSNELLFQAGNEYVWFQQFDSERSSNAQYAMRFNVSASRLKPYIGAEHIRTARRTPEIDTRARRVDHSVLSGLGFDLTPRTALTASAKLEEVRYDEGETFRGVALDNSLNRSGRLAEAGVRYAVTPFTTLAVTAGWEQQTFVQSHIRDVKRYTVGPALEFSPEAAIRGRVAAAFETFKPDDPALAEHRDITYQAAVNWALYDRTTFDLGAGRNITYSYEDTEPYYQQTGIRLLVSQPLPVRFELYGGGNREWMAYRWRHGAAVADSDRVDDLIAVNAGIGIRFSRSIHVRCGLEKTQRRSVEEPLQNYTRTRFLTTVTVGS